MQKLNAKNLAGKGSLLSGVPPTPTDVLSFSIFHGHTARGWQGPGVVLGVTAPMGVPLAEGGTNSKRPCSVSESVSSHTELSSLGCRSGAAFILGCPA